MRSAAMVGVIETHVGGQPGSAHALLPEERCDLLQSRQRPRRPSALAPVRSRRAVRRRRWTAPTIAPPSSTRASQPSPSPGSSRPSSGCVHRLPLGLFSEKIRIVAGSRREGDTTSSQVRSHQAEVATYSAPCRTSSRTSRRGRCARGHGCRPPFRLAPCQRADVKLVGRRRRQTLGARDPLRRRPDEGGADEVPGLRSP